MQTLHEIAEQWSLLMVRLVVLPLGYQDWDCGAVRCFAVGGGREMRDEVYG